MSKYALINSGTVENVIEADQSHVDSIKSQYDSVVNIDSTQAGPGWSYDGTNFTAPPAPPGPRTISRIDFRMRFTEAEKKALYAARSSNVDIEIWLDDVQAADTINLDDPHIVSGMDALVTAGIITSARKTAILS